MLNPNLKLKAKNGIGGIQIQLVIPAASPREEKTKTNYTKRDKSHVSIQVRSNSRGRKTSKCVWKQHLLCGPQQNITTALLTVFLSVTNPILLYSSDFFFSFPKGKNQQYIMNILQVMSWLSNHSLYLQGN